MSGETDSSNVVALASLRNALKRFMPVLAEDGVEELMINKPGEYFVERAGRGIERVEDPEVSYKGLLSLAKLLANYSQQSIGATNMVLGASLPSGERVQMVIPPCAEEKTVAVSIRKYNTVDWSLDDLGQKGVFDRVGIGRKQQQDLDQQLQERLDQGDYIGFLTEATKAKKTIVLSGSVSSGKTTMINAILANIPMHERIITLEDVRDTVLQQPNRLHLLYAKDGTASNNPSAGQLLEVCLRLRPDRIILQEIRGREAYDFLNVITSGHPGSVTTVHANDVRGAFERLARCVGDHPSSRNMRDPEGHLRQAIDIVLQVKRDARDGWRGLTEVYFEPNR